MNDKIDFMIIGAMKCGTTSVARVLAGHPKVSFYNAKESHFFATTKDWKRNLPEYLSHFRNREGKLLGEASPTYTAMPSYNLNTPESIYHHNPDMKIIYIMRDPVERVVSHYTHFLARGYVKNEIDKSILESRTILDQSRYFFQIAPYLEFFGSNQILLLVFEDLLTDSIGFYGRIFEFLSLDEYENVHYDQHSNKTISKPRINKRLDFIFRFIYEDRIGKTIRNMVPSSLRTFFTNSIRPLFERKVDRKPELREQTVSMLRNYFKSDVNQIELILNRKLEIWEKYYGIK